MKHFLIGLFLVTMPALQFAQNCMDAIILSKDSKFDTIPCKILGITDLYYTIDYGDQVSSVAKNEISDTLMCYRNMTLKEIERYEGIDAINGYNLDNTNLKTSGLYLRKATYNFYTGFGITAAGGLALGLGCNIKNMNNVVKGVCIISGSIASAIGLFFVLRGCHHIYQAGKILDLEKAAVYIAPTEKGDLGVLLKF